MPLCVPDVNPNEAKACQRRLIRYPATVNTNRFTGVLLLFWFGLAVACVAQAPKADRELFQQVKAEADKGNAEAQLRLGDMYATGTGVTLDRAKAARWHRKAAEQGLARAQYQLGLDLVNGIGVKRNAVEAASWYRQAAEQGLVEAQIEFGLCCAHGVGMSESNTEAVGWFRKAAEQGSPAAEFQLGRCYFEGAGVARDVDAGVQWTQRAADKGYAPAQNRLGLCCQKGEGLTTNLVEAYKWFILAAAQDDEQAADIRVSIAKIQTGMTPEQITEAQRLAREFKPAQGTATASKATAQAAAEPSGFVTVNAAEESSEIFVDGGFVGNPPAKLKLAQGSHAIEVRKAGFRNYSKTLSVTAGADLTLRVVLERN